MLFSVLINRVWVWVRVGEYSFLNRAFLFIGSSVLVLKDWIWEAVPSVSSITDFSKEKLTRKEEEEGVGGSLNEGRGQITKTKEKKRRRRKKWKKKKKNFFFFTFGAFFGILWSFSFPVQKCVSFPLKQRNENHLSRNLLCQVCPANNIKPYYMKKI